MAFGDGITFGDYGWDTQADPFSQGFGMDQGSDNYVDPNGPEAWQNSQEGKSAWQNQGSDLASYGIPQSRLADLWNKTQGNEYANKYDAMGQLGSTQKLLNNDWFLTKGADGSYGLMPKMNHGWNQEYLSMAARVFAPMLFSDGGILSAGGDAAATEGASELGASFGSDLGNNFDAFGGGFGLEGSTGSGFDAALSGLGSSAPALNYGNDEFADDGLNNYKTPDTASGGGIGGGSQGTSLTGGDGKPSQEQSQLQKDFLKLAGNQVKPGLGNVAAAGGSAMDDGKGLWGTGLTANDIASGLQGLYGMYQANHNLGGLTRNLANMYSPNSMYADELRKQLTRRDAAAGRRSQYGPRETELQAKLAQQYSQNAPHLMQAQNQLAANRMAMGTNLMGLGMKALPSLQRLWNSESAPTGDQLSTPEFGQLPQNYNNAFSGGFGFDQPQQNYNYFDVPNLGGGY